MNLQKIIDSINHYLNSGLDDITLTNDDLQTIKKALINYKLQDMQNTMYRPCFVDGKKALFHRWTAYNVIDYAIVEYENGTVDIVHPQSIKFVPGKFNEYNFTEEKQWEKRKSNQRQVAHY